MSAPTPGGGIRADAAWGKSEAPFGMKGRQRDLFPLPQLLCEVRGAGRRVARRRAECALVNDAVHALNSMYFGPRGWDGVSPGRCPQELHEPQREVLQNLLEDVRILGPPPNEMTSQRAREELLASSMDYAGVTDTRVGSKASFDLDLLSLPNDGFKPVPLNLVLEGEAADCLNHFDSKMLLDAPLWGQRCDSVCKIGMYTDPALKGQGGLLFVVKLLRAGIMKLARKPRARVGAFAVWKKPGEHVQKQRLVVDCRRVNALFREPPYTELGSVDSLSECCLKPGDTMYLATADIKDCFYECGLRDEVAEYFGLDFSVRVCDLRWEGIDVEAFC